MPREPTSPRSAAPAAGSDDHLRRGCPRKRLIRKTLVDRPTDPYCFAEGALLSGGGPVAADNKAVPSSGLVFGGFVAIAIGTFIATAIYNTLDPAVPDLAEGLSPFAAIYVAAQALERLLEPFSGWVLGNTKAQAKSKLLSARANDNVQEEIGARRELKAVRADRAIFFWAVATVLAMFASATAGLFLLHLIGVAGAPSWMDILVTGLAIGGGTKPLHDLIARIEKSKEKAEAE